MRSGCLTLTWVLAFSLFSLAGPVPPPPPAGGVDTASIDPTVNPCQDFYRFACGRWNATHPIPPDQSRWGRFNELQEHNQLELRKLLEAAEDTSKPRDPIHQKVGDYYAACMNETEVEAAGAKPLHEELERIAGIKDRAGLIHEIARLRRLGVGTLFAFGARPDYKDANQVIAALAQGGLGLPNRDYYTNTDPRSVELRQQYTAHVARMLGLLGESSAQAQGDATTVLAIETGLAQNSLKPAQLRNPDNVYHPMTLVQLERLTPEWNWPAYFTTVAPEGVTIAPATYNIAEPAFFTALDAQLKSRPLGEWKAYLRWHLVNAKAAVLSSPFVNEDFAFSGKTLSGARELQPRWKRCVRYTDGALGEALGPLYVEAAFPNSSRLRMRQLVAAVEGQLQQDIEQLPWMSPATRQQAVVKLHAISNKIGYPEKWRDYSTLHIERDSFYDDNQQADSFEVHRTLDKIGKPLDRTEWGMTPPTVNAYYNPSVNEIVFPAGILQPPFFDAGRDDAANYGGIGVVIGHELTHGFDDQGSRFDAQGNLREWWTPTDRAEFEKRVSCVADEYSGFTVPGDVHLNGRLTLGENTADNGGLRIAYMAMLTAATGVDRAPLEGYTPEQRFFLGYAQIWCSNQTDQSLRLQAATDPHSPGEYRVNGAVANFDAFQKAFHCGPTAPMVRGAGACRVW